MPIKLRTKGIACVQTVLVTGANRGIGFEIARQYLARGAEVLACCRAPDKAQGLLDLRPRYPSLGIFKADMGDFSSLESLAYALKDKKIDLLINNAGSYGPKGIPEGKSYQTFGAVDYQIWSDILRINLQAPLRMAELFVENVAASAGKTIVMMSSELGSIAGNISAGQSYSYRSSKAALNMVTKGLALDLAGRGITVVAMAPGWVRTDMGGRDIAALSPAESVAGQISVLASLQLKDSGSFVDYRGAKLPW